MSAIVQNEAEVFWTDQKVLKPEQIAEVKKLKSILDSLADKKVTQHERDHNTLCRFLKARKWDAEKAKEMYVAHAEWRNGPMPAPPEPPFSPEEVQKIKQLYPHFYHKVDVHGRPVYYELVGELQITELLKHVSLDRLIKLHIMGWEKTRNDIFPACSEQVGREIFTCLAVLDLKGMTLGTFNRDVREFIARIAAIDQSFYPEHLGQMFIVNAPFVFRSIWAVIRPWLEPRTQRKIQVLSGEQALEQLKDVIPPENLISRLGGKSEYDPCVTDLGFPITKQDSDSLKSSTPYGSAKSSLTTVSMDIG